MNKFLRLTAASFLMLSILMSASMVSAAGGAVLISSETITRGVKLEQWTYPTSAGTARVSVIEVDLKDRYIDVDAIYGKDGKTGSKQTTLNMAKEAGAVAAINGDFFTLTAEGAPFGITVKSGEMINSPGYISSKNALILDDSGVPFIERVNFSAQVVASNGSLFQLFGLNKTQYNAGYAGYTGKSHYDRLHMYDSRWNPGSWVGNSLGAPYTVVVVKNDVVASILENQTVQQIPSDTYLLLAHGAAEAWVNQNIHVGDTLRVNMTLSPGIKMNAAVDGSTMLLKNGQKTPITYEIKGNVARTAVGYSFDKRFLYMVSVEKSGSSVGMTLDQLSSFLLYKGLCDAVNLDGGGSTTMIARNLGKFTYKNAVTPQYGAQRAVPNGLAVFTKAPEGELKNVSISVPGNILAGETVTAKIDSAYDEYYNPVPTSSLAVDWDKTNGVKITELVDGFNFVFDSPGNYRLDYEVENLNKSVDVHVAGRSDIVKLELDHGFVQIHPGETVNLKATMTFKNGTKRTVPGDLLYWRLEGVNGNITNNGTLTADAVSTGTLFVEYDGFISATPVTIEEVEVPVEPSEPESIQLKFFIGKNEAMINETPRTIAQAPQVVNGRTYLPLRAYAELLGAYVEWNMKEQKVEIKYNGQVLNFWIGKPELTVDGEKSTIDAPPFVAAGSTMVPLRAAGEAFGMYIDYRKGVQSITVTSR